MTVPDLVNGMFEVIGGLMCWINVVKLHSEKRVAGVYWPVQAFFSCWGLWNLYYYPALGQWASFVGGVFLVVGNATWTIMAAWYSKKNDDLEKIGVYGE